MGMGCQGVEELRGEVVEKVFGRVGRKVGGKGVLVGKLRTAREEKVRGLMARFGQERLFGWRKGLERGMELWEYWMFEQAKGEGKWRGPWSC